MEVVVSLGGFLRSELPSALVEQLCAIRPPDGESLVWTLAELDPALPRLRACFEAAGWRPGLGPGPAQEGQYILHAERHYHPEDLAQAEYFEPSPYLGINAKPEWDASGRLIIRSEYLLAPLPREIAAAGDGGNEGLAVCSVLKAELEHAGLRGLIFGKAGVQGPQAERFQGSWWELTSELVLPPLAPHGDLVPLQQFHPADRRCGCVLRQPPYVPSELHYRQSQLASLGAFDLARVREDLLLHAGEDAPHRRFVASRRFYEFCQARSLNLRGIPVRIDRD
jgi:hypothetical protein